MDDASDTAVIGAGLIGLSVGYYLVKQHGVRDIVLIDPRDPMSLTSAQSGENYRNWWPHALMTTFTDHGIDLLEAVAAETGNRIAMTRRGYVLVTRRDAPEDLLEDLRVGYGGKPGSQIRMHEAGASSTYHPAGSAGWEEAPDGVDVLRDRALIRETFPTFAPDVATVLHVRRAGSISGQQLGQHMLETIRAAGGRLVRAEVVSIGKDARFVIGLSSDDGPREIRADRIVNAAGPYFRDVARLLGEDMPVKSVYQQKIAFEDREGAVPRDLPFAIDLDGQRIAWSDEDRAILAEDPNAAKLLDAMPGGIHCRPDGAFDGRWIKLGWAYNARATDPHAPDPIDAQFPDTVLRGASRLQPRLAAYIGRLPRGVHHYGGYYTMTDENLPLIGAMRTPGAFMAGALSGFGTMAACAAGSLCAAWMSDRTVPDYARFLDLSRYDDAAVMGELKTQAHRSHL